MVARVAEVKAAPASPLADRHVIGREGATAIWNSFGADALEDAVEFRLADLEGVMVTGEAGIGVEVEGQRLIDPHGGEMPCRPRIGETEDAREEARRLLLVARRNDHLIAHDAHSHFLLVVFDKYVLGRPPGP